MTESDFAQQDGRTAPAVKRLLVVLSAHEPEATGPSEAKDERDIELIRYAADLAERWNADLSAFVPVERPGEIGRIASAIGL
ncbi:MAG: hypothetical protein R3360_07940, partial [Alphaproteobacteria bacterium]|nr:hypothetical protein [Alphaproteobacteria bacterium]